MRRTLLLAVFLAATASAEQPNADLAGFDRAVTPFLKAHCLICHGDTDPQAGLSLNTLAPDLPGGKDWRAWARIRDRIRTGEMPPEDKPRPKSADIDAALTWLDAELVKAKSVGRVAKAPAARSGPAIPTEHLFDGSHDAPFSASPRVWRVSPQIYLQMVGDVAGKNNSKGIALPFGAANTKGGFGDNDSGQLDEAAVQGMIRNASAVATAQTAFKMVDGKPKGGPKPFEPFALPDAKPTDAQVEAAIRHQFQTALRRQPTPDELERFLGLARKTIGSAGPLEGLRLALTAVLLKAEAAFRSELGTGKPDAQGRVMLAPRELAFALSYALTDRRPDDELIKAADKGQLSTPQQVAAQAWRILDSPKIPKDRVQRFFREYFEYSSAPEVFKDRKDLPGFNARTLVNDTDRLVDLIVEEDKNVFEELLTTRRSFVNYGYDKKRKIASRAEKSALEKIYGFETWPEHQPVMLPEAERAGILTQPAWLVAHSTSFDNHAILRGKWVREKLLGGGVPDLPITVDAQLPDDPKRTLRDRMTVTRADYCWNCHRKMNDLGLTFESFDHFGRFRTTELAKPVDSTGAITFAGELDGNVPDAVAMIRKLAKTDAARRVFLRHLFRFVMGRDETLGDGPTLRLMDKTYLESGGSFRKTLVALLASDSFLYRSANVEPSQGDRP